MNKSLKIFLVSTITLGICCVGVAVLNVEKSLAVGITTLVLSGGILLALRLTLELPKTGSRLTFADSIVFFAFLVFGGEVAIILATFEALINCIYLKNRGVHFSSLTIPFNVFSATISTTLAYSVLQLLNLAGISFSYSTNSDLLIVLSVLAMIQCVVLSGFATGFHWLKTGNRFWHTWKKVSLSASVTQIAGAGLAGIGYNLYYSSNVITFLIAITLLALAYLNYRQMFSDINDSILQAEQAEKEKADLARQQVIEAQEHAGELEDLLEKEEKISEDLRQSKKDLQHAAFHDNLTDLPNRAYLIERLELLLKLGIDVSQNYYVLFLDLSRFKNINDSLGHTIGDEVLQIVALRLRRTLKDEDTVARLGGDEFAILLNDVDSLEEAEAIAQKVHSKLSEPFNIQENRIYCDLNIGIAPFDAEHIKPADVIRDADIAMHNAKENKTGIAVFDKEVRAEYLEQIRLEGDLRYAADRGEFSMQYQPLINLRTGGIMGCEALLRWQHPELGFVSPAKFVPICEDSGLIIPITEWILKETTDRMAAWQKINEDYRDMLVSVNISGRHLADERLITDVESALIDSGLRPSCLKLEITESIAMENAEKTIEILGRLKSIGVKISIDDFGTGYSSLSYLHRLPFDTLKIDRSFVINVSEKNEDTQILETIVSLTKTLKKEVIAEGIETIEQLYILQELGCDYGQGYLFSRPLPVPELETELYKKRDWLPEMLELETEHPSGPDIHASLF